MRFNEFRELVMKLVGDAIEFPDTVVTAYVKDEGPRWVVGMYNVNSASASDYVAAGIDKGSAKRFVKGLIAQLSVRRTLRSA
jgi:hypothetical protein